MSGMVERVRAAIENAAEYSDDWIPGTDVRDHNITNWDDMARAAIAAMREPTEEMWQIGDAHIRESGSMGDEGWEPTLDSTGAWQAMIDAALEGK